MGWLERRKGREKGMRRVILAVMLLFWAGGHASSAAEFIAATKAEAAAALGENDFYMRTLTPADLSIRLRDPNGGALGALRQAYAGAALEWSEQEKARLAGAVARHRADLDALARWLPPTVYFAKASEAVEGGLPHTRGATIVWGAVIA
jgi:hypothetical protein